MKNDEIEILFAKHYNDALLYSLSLTKNYAVAEDIVSNSFFKALKTIDYTINDFKPWLIKVCRNEYLSYLRKQKQVTELNDNIKQEGQSIIDEIIKGEEYRALFNTISLLQPFQKEVLTLFYYENMTVKDIANITNKNETVIKVTLYRARENLKKILNKII